MLPMVAPNAARAMLLFSKPNTSCAKSRVLRPSSEFSFAAALQPREKTLAILHGSLPLPSSLASGSRSVRHRRGNGQMPSNSVILAAEPAAYPLETGTVVAQLVDIIRGSVPMATITTAAPAERKPFYTSLFLQVLAGLVLGIILGMAAPAFAVSLKI